MSGVTVKAQGLKEIEQMFRQLPKQVGQDKIWGRFWRKVSKPLKEAAAGNVKDAPKDIPYPPDTSLKIRKGTLRKSIQFYRTRASKQVYGAYIGPRVKGKFAKNKGGYFGAWVEYGHKIKHKNSITKDNPFMEKAFKSKSGTVLSNGFKDAEKIFVSAVKSHEKRLKKYGTFGY
jgi:hypothetical protein|tara:strand:+ start:1919 stop:2440 length:522 start_codon:yes stop_codon:yes gene_type:complete